MRTLEAVPKWVRLKRSAVRKMWQLQRDKHQFAAREASFPRQVLDVQEVFKMNSHLVGSRENV